MLERIEIRPDGTIVIERRSDAPADQWAVPYVPDTPSIPTNPQWPLQPTIAPDWYWPQVWC